MWRLQNSGQSEQVLFKLKMNDPNQSQQDSHRHCAVALFVCTKLWNVVHSKNSTDLKLKICSTKLLQVCLHKECNINENRS